MNNNFFQVFYERKEEFFKAVLEHIQISFYALVIALIIAIPLGISRNNYWTYSSNANYPFTCITWIIDSSYGNW